MPKVTKEFPRQKFGTYRMNGTIVSGQIPPYIEELAKKGLVQILEVHES